MTGAELRAARKSLGLTLAQMAPMLDRARGAEICRMECSDNPLPARIARLVAAYLAGYRPDDWPETKQTKL